MGAYVSGDGLATSVWGCTSGSGSTACPCRLGQGLRSWFGGYVGIGHFLTGATASSPLPNTTLLATLTPTADFPGAQVLFGFVRWHRQTAHRRLRPPKPGRAAEPSLGAGRTTPAGGMAAAANDPLSRALCRCLLPAGKKVGHLPPGELIPSKAL